VSPPAAITVRDLSVGWAPNAALVEHASFAVHPGEIFGLLGRSASGKTTMLRALCGLEDPLRGTIALADGLPPDIGGGRPRFGVMFQQGALFGSLTVGQNIALTLERWTRLPPGAVRALVRARLRLVGLEHAEHLLPDTLSGGMRKRAAIARAMALEPSLLFLDEPSSGLDPITSAEIDRLIFSVSRGLGLTVVMVTHELGSITSIVDRCVMVDGGTRRIVGPAAPRELASSDEPLLRQFFTRTPEAT
jgi:phospholipid/cholesterol/gamma-HCH transport system ATP-binding protein